MPRFIEELRRRNLFRITAGYVVVAWLLIQAASIILPTFHTPEWVFQVFVFFVALGFPLALVLAWASGERPKEKPEPANHAANEITAEPKPKPRLDLPPQDIHFCTAQDGVRIAYTTVGSGPPLVKTANWMNHLEFDWENSTWRHIFKAFSDNYSFTRYDSRGNGLSDWDTDEFSLSAMVADLEAVVDAAGLDQFALLGISQGCAVSVEYAVRHPERVTKLVLFGGYARGWRVGSSQETIAQTEALRTLMLKGWGQDNPVFRQLFTSLLIPGGTPEEFDSFNELQKMTTSPKNASNLMDALGDVDIRDRLALVKVPTLVLHSRGDMMVDVDRGRELATGISGARFVTLDCDNHMPLERDRAWPRFLEEMTAFLKDD